MIYSFKYSDSPSSLGGENFHEIKNTRRNTHGMIDLFAGTKKYALTKVQNYDYSINSIVNYLKLIALLNSLRFKLAVARFTYVIPAKRDRERPFVPS